MSQDLAFGLVVTRGESVLELDGAWGGNQSFEVFKCGGLHLVVTEVVPVSYTHLTLPTMAVV